MKSIISFPQKTQNPRHKNTATEPLFSLVWSRETFVHVHQRHAQTSSVWRLSHLRPAKTWLSCVEKDMESYGLENAVPLNRAEWRKCISQLLYTSATGRPTAV